MQVEDYCWKRAKSVELYGKLFIPDSPVSVLVIMVHGIGEHSGCYDEWGEKFTLQSIGFLAFDLRGHGRSSGRRGHASILDIKDDLQAIIKDIRKRFSDIPVVLLGHSMGGHIVLSFAIDQQNVDIQGVIVSSPWLQLVRPPSLLLVKAAQWASYLVPWITVRTGIRAEQLSQGSVGTKSTKTDPLLHKRISIKLFSDLYANSETLLRNNHRLNVPVLMMHGTSDSLVSFKASKLFARKNKKMITFRKWSKMRHDLLHDARKDMVFRYVTYWLSKHIIAKWNYSEQS